jgi:hypothetical protein
MVFFDKSSLNRVLRWFFILITNFFKDAINFSFDNFDISKRVPRYNNSSRYIFHDRTMRMKYRVDRKTICIWSFSEPFRWIFFWKMSLQNSFSFFVSVQSSGMWVAVNLPSVWLISIQSYLLVKALSLLGFHFL